MIGHVRVVWSAYPTSMPHPKGGPENGCVGGSAPRHFLPRGMGGGEVPAGRCSAGRKPGSGVRKGIRCEGTLCSAGRKPGGGVRKGIRCKETLCSAGRKPGGGVRKGICREGTLRGGRVVPERALGGQVLSISPGAVAPCQSAFLLGRGHPDPSGCPVHGGGPDPVGCSTGGIGGARKSLAVPQGSPAGFCSTTPGEFPPVVSARGRAFSHPDSFGCSAPMRENDSAREAVLESLVEAQPYREFCPPVGRRALTAGPYGPLPFWRWVPCPGESAGDPCGSDGVGSLGSYGSARPRLVLSLPLLSTL
jgi:hypothetical protein